MHISKDLCLKKYPEIHRERLPSIKGDQAFPDFAGVNLRLLLLRLSLF